MSNFRVPVAALPLLIVLALGACTSGNSRQEDVATTGGKPTPPAGTSDDPLARELEFVACMRKAGIDMPDPIPGDKSGRSALLTAMDRGMGLKDAFQTALDGCVALLPPGEKPAPPDPGDVEKRRQFAQCMRDNGIKDYPDPDPVAGKLTYWFLENDAVAKAALEKCRNLLPSPSPEKPAQ